MSLFSRAQALAWAEQGALPDAVIRAGVRAALRRRLAEIAADDVEAAVIARDAFAATMRAAPIALAPDKANEQHYDLPPAFFAGVLGRHRKYSGCWWPDGVGDLDAAEAAALTETCARAELVDGQEILELGCGWGSLSLWMAERYPASQITALSSSASQRAFIEGEARARGLSNLTVVTQDVTEFVAAPGRFDRVVSVEMFEHLRNYEEMFARVASWLKPDGRFFMHIFCHRSTPYPFVVRDDRDWMTRYFFEGGMMPSDDLPLLFQRDLKIVRQWRWNGRHYERTANAWLARMDAQRAALFPLLAAHYGPDEARRWWGRWRIFFISCAELFGFNEGREWYIGHYLFGK